MIQTRTPLRVTLGGGGTDLANYPGDGFCLAAAIDQYVYVSIVENFDGDLLVTYSKSERVEKAAQLEHPLARGCLEKTGVTTGLHISSMADIPSGTGLGSSAAYTVGLLNALYAYTRVDIEPWRLALHACEVEKIGQQDQHIAAFGGIQKMIFESACRPKVLPVPLPLDTEQILEENLLLFYTGLKHDAEEALAASVPASRETKEIGIASFEALLRGDLRAFARLLTLQWRVKGEKNRNPANALFDDQIKIGLEAGADGGKLVGAGGGGFLMFYAENKTLLREAMQALGLREVRFRFDYRGSIVL